MRDIDEDGDTNEEGGINFRSEAYLIARTGGTCMYCHGETRLVALMLPPGHESWSDSWERTPRQALLFYVDSLPEAVRHRLQGLAPAYRFAESQATQSSYWANHCERCGGLQEDHELFCEPEGAFLPISPAAAATIELMPVRESLEVRAAGYAIDPAFIASDVRA